MPTRDKTVQRWDVLAKKYQHLGLDLSSECQALGLTAAYCNSEVDTVYNDYVRLHKFICAQVDIINEKIKQIDPAYVKC